MLIVQEKETPTSRLGVLTQLFERLHAEDVVYCHWKGNVRLEAALSGEKDVDLLVDRKAVIALAGILSDLGFKRFAAIPQCAYPGIEDYLALDRRTGKLVHLHVHYQLTLTKKNAAGYRLPWEDLVLSTRKLDTEEEIHVADPNVELVLFIVRAALRLRALPALLLGRWRTAFQGSAQEEFCWLASRVDEEQLSSIAREKVGERAAVMLLALLAGEASANQLLAFRRSMWPRPRDYRTFGIWTALWRMWNREWALRLWRARNRYWQWTGPDRRVLPQGGLIVAFVGADGSGKSTVTTEITRWLSWKLDVVRIYFGSGDGPASLLRRSLRALNALQRSLRSLFRGNTGQPHADGAAASWQDSPGEREAIDSSRGLRTLWKLISKISLAREKRARLTWARRARNQGVVVICDRFPQCQIMGFNDGPLLTPWLDGSSRLLRAAARREQAVYRAAEAFPPDLVIKLCVSPAVAWRRKPEMSLETLCRRAEAVRALQYPPGTRVLEIGSDQPIDKVLLQAKQAIWDSI